MLEDLAKIIAVNAEITEDLLQQSVVDGDETMAKLLRQLDINNRKLGQAYIALQKKIMDSNLSEKMLKNKL